MATTNEGARLFKLALEKRGHSQADAARELGLDSGYMSRLVSGERSPSLKLSDRIFQAYGVPVGAWLQAATDQKPAPSAA